MHPIASALCRATWEGLSHGAKALLAVAVLHTLVERVEDSRDDALVCLMGVLPIGLLCLTWIQRQDAPPPQAGRSLTRPAC